MLLKKNCCITPVYLVLSIHDSQDVSVAAGAIINKVGYFVLGGFELLSVVGSALFTEVGENSLLTCSCLTSIGVTQICLAANRASQKLVCC